MKLIGVDVGGTFTDLVLEDTDRGTSFTHKVPSTPDDPSVAVLAGILELCERFHIDRAEVDHVFHGTTVATNAILEHDGARTGMVTNRGYRDIIHIGRHQRPENYSIMQEIPWQDRPLVERRNRFVVDGRLTPRKGEVLAPLDEQGVREAARRLREQGIEAVCVCFLFSYIDPAHEDRAKAILEEELPGVYISTSSSVAPVFREFERFTTAAMNAFVGPKVRRYVRNLKQAIGEAGMRADLHVMGSNGGVATAEAVADKPVLTLLSGPAAGVLGGAWAGALSGRDNLITFDIGGTSADIGIVRGGAFGEASARDTWIAGFPVLVPMIDIHTIGAGGGSLAYTDEGGAFRVGPRSAGAKPGPAAYARGGDKPTVTDANVVLGRLDPDNFLGGEMTLDAPAAHRAIDGLAKQLGMSDLETAEGVLRIINSNMANAIRSRTIQKGIDPRDFTLVAFGGAGPLHGAEVALMLDIPEVLIPPYPGINSAVGLLTTDVKYAVSRTEFMTQGAVDAGHLTTDFAEMEAQLGARFERDGIGSSAVRFERDGELRYVGQGYELRVPFPAGEIDTAALAAVWADFTERHRVEYGHVFAENAIEIVNVRVTGIATMPKIARPTVPAGGSLADALIKEGRCVFRAGDRLESVPTLFYRRDRLPVAQPIPGPAVILQKDTTTIVPPACTVTADAAGNLIIRTGVQDNA